jgi:glucose-6-phosphate 1-epimerase
MIPRTSLPSLVRADFTPIPGAGGLPKLVLVAADGARAELYLHGAQVTSWVPAGESQDRLFLSSQTQYKAGVAIRGGVPVSFPQFAAEGPLPNHGFARVSTWDLVHAGRAASGAARAVLRLEDSEATRTLWPHPFRAELTVCLVGSTLEMGLSVTNTGSTDLAYTAALHTYLQVADVQQTVVRGLRNACYKDKVLGAGRVIDTTPELRIVGQIDRVYCSAPDLEVHESVRTMSVRATGFPDTVVWNPGEQAGAALNDLEPGGYARMLCVEAAVVRTPIKLGPGEQWLGRQTLTAG